MTFKDYCALEAVNFSTLKHIKKSPLHYQHAVKYGREDNTGLLKGRATHTAVFEPDEFNKRYAIFEGKRRAGAEWKEFQEEHKDKEILKVEERDLILETRDAIVKHPVVRKILSQGKAEQTITWKDPMTGITCKGRLDWFSPEYLADLKGTPDADARRFGSLTARQSWHVQQAFYLDGLNAALDISPAKVSIIAAEFNPPHDIAVFTLTEDDLIAGRETYQEWLVKVVECRETGIWPGRFPEEQLISLPKYVYDEEDQDDNLGLVISEPEEEAA